MRKLNFVLILLFFTTSIFAQSPRGRLVIKANPPWAIISINNDTSIARKSNIIMLDSGYHSIKVYGNKLETFETNFTIRKDTSIAIFKTLKYEKEYIEYVKAVKSYNSNKMVVTYVPPVVIVGLIGAGVIFNNKANDYYNAAKKNIDDYMLSISEDEIKRLKKDKDQNEKNYRLSKTLSYASYGLAAVATYEYIHLLRKQSKKKTPVYKEGFSFNMNSFNNFSLSYAF